MIVLVFLLTSVLTHLLTINLHAQQLLLPAQVVIWHLERHLSLGMTSVDPKNRPQFLAMRAISVQGISQGRDQT